MTGASAETGRRRTPLTAGRRAGLVIGLVLVGFYAVLLVAIVLEPANRHRLFDFRAFALAYFSPLLAVGLGMAVSAWKRTPDWRPPGKLAGIRRSVAVIGVIAMIVAVFDMFSRGFEYTSHFNLGLFGLPVFCAGLLTWWLAVRRGR